MAQGVARVSLKAKITGLFAVLLAVLLVAFAVFTYVQQWQRLEMEVLDQARTMNTEMRATWDFVSLNQNTINYDSAGNFDYKGLHCALAGKSVAVLFGEHSGSTIRFTKLEPRNIYNAPDEYETAALQTFEEDPAVSEVYSFAGNGEAAVFRYVSVMPVTKDCIDCHGAPAGEVDLTGYPKEGWAIGDVGGATSITIPISTYWASMVHSIEASMAFFLLALAVLSGVLYFALSRMVTRPLAQLGVALRQVDAAPSTPVHAPAAPDIYKTTETTELLERFDAMSAALAELYRNLEGRVEDRTRQLEQANEQLEAQRAHVERVNARLQEENQYKSDFLAIVSHELRTPLTSILAFADLMEGRLPEGDDGLAGQLEEIQKNGRVLLEMVNNVLESARIQAGSERLNLELVDLADMMNMIEAAHAGLAEKKHIALAAEIEPDLPLIMSDWEKVRRILTNLVSNAIKFTDEGGWVRVEARAAAAGAGVGGAGAGEWVELTVADNGIGIPADKQDLVFERFTQENMSTQRRYGGSGLGLSLVRELAHMLGGEVHLQSERGVGSVFSVVLPVAGPAPSGEVESGKENLQ